MKEVRCRERLEAEKQDVEHRLFDLEKRKENIATVYAIASELCRIRMNEDTETIQVILENRDNGRLKQADLFAVYRGAGLDRARVEQILADYEDVDVFEM